MNIVKSIDQFKINNVYFGQEQKNNVINDSKFLRIFYSTEYFALNGIFIIINLKNVTVDNYFAKQKISFCVKENKQEINKIKMIEDDILNKISIPNNSKSFDIFNQFEKGNIKVFSNSNNEYQKKNIKIIIKLSGIWDNNKAYGITYKFIPIETY